ncbi:hypothetical protein Scep_012305 [Stephania cephalantha]|uniref:Uncharacterized protein n=1 Tax=Stephania cephalantha TaxID=152367 RepID=A0AAP0JFC0_9MAGN
MSWNEGKTRKWQRSRPPITFYAQAHVIDFMSLRHEMTLQQQHHQVDQRSKSWSMF